MHVIVLTSANSWLAFVHLDLVLYMPECNVLRALLTTILPATLLTCNLNSFWAILCMARPSRPEWRNINEFRTLNVKRECPLAVVWSISVCVCASSSPETSWEVIASGDPNEVVCWRKSILDILAAISLNILNANTSFLRWMLMVTWSIMERRGCSWDAETLRPWGELRALGRWDPCGQPVAGRDARCSRWIASGPPCTVVDIFTIQI